jgi:spermidine synthase
MATILLRRLATASRQLLAGTHPPKRLIVAAILLLALAFAPSRSAGRELVETRESLYNSIFVYNDDGYFTMTFGHNRRLFSESKYNPRDELELPFAYTRTMTVSLAYADVTPSILEIGFGGGRTAWYLHRQLRASNITCVELDSDVVALAKKYFGVRDEPNFSIFVKDGRIFLNQANERKDIILVDAYRGPFVPFHLMTKEFYSLAKSRLKPGGALALNIEPTTMLFEAAVATLGSVFANVDLYEAEGNVIAVAYDGAPRPIGALQRRADELQKQFQLRYPLAPIVQGRNAMPHSTQGQVLTDDFAPVEYLKAIERHNQKLGDSPAVPK